METIVTEEVIEKDIVESPSRLVERAKFRRTTPMFYSPPPLSASLSPSKERNDNLVQAVSLQTQTRENSWFKGGEP